MSLTQAFFHNFLCFQIPMEKPIYNKKHDFKFQPKKKAETTDNDAKKETASPEEKPVVANEEVVKTKETPKKVVKNLLHDELEVKAETVAPEPIEAKETEAPKPKKLVKNLLRDEPEAKTKTTTPESIEKPLVVPPKKELKKPVLRSKPSDSEPRSKPRPRVEKTLKFVPKKKFNEPDRRDNYERREPRAERPLKFVPKKKEAGAFDKFKEKDKKAEAKKVDKQPAKDPGTVGTRLNKYLAHSGLGTRRQTSALVFEGKVKVNGEVMLNPAYAVQEGDVVETEGKSMKPKSKLTYLLLNKPKNSTTEVIEDPENEQRTAQSIVATKHKEKVVPFDEMGINVTGLLVLTNDDPLTEKFQNPEQKIKRVFHLKLDKMISIEELQAVEQALQPATGPVKGQAISHVVGADLNEVGITLMLGNIASIQAAFAQLDFTIKKLDCTYYAGLTKKDLPRGWFRKLNKQEVIMLKHFI